ncbi:MAG: cytidylate kinase-like family protein [Sphaerochaetaceae bacterium]|jgi:cytidylate kinase
MKAKTVISISRQFGSGGREIGRLIAKELGIPFYDRALINLAAEKSGMDKQVLENLDEKAGNRFLYTVPSTIPSVGSHTPTTIYNMPLGDTLFLTEYEIIKQLAEEGSCVIVGRCSDYVLKETENHISVFIHAPEACRAKRIAEYEKISEKEALSRISKYDKERKKYHDYYASGTWANAPSYDLTINSSLLGLKESAAFICSFVKKFEEKGKV